MSHEMQPPPSTGDAGPGQIGQQVRAFYSDTPFPWDLDAYGPWTEQAPKLLNDLGLDPELAKDRTLLDAGCGTGTYSRSFANLGAKVTGVDLTPASLNRARELDRSINLRTPVDYREGSVFNLPEDQTFDIVISLGVLHHTENPELAFASVSRAVKPNGLLIAGLYSPISRAHILTARGVIKVLARGDEETEFRLASSRLLRKLRVMSVGEAHADSPPRIRDLLVHPNEKPVLLQSAMRWYRKAGFRIIGSNPSLDINNYPELRWLYRRVPANAFYSALQLRWLAWLADYYVLAGQLSSR